MSTETDAIDTAVDHGRTQNHKTKIVKVHQCPPSGLNNLFPKA
ncbi:hypothetical protein R75483_07268 [Paraburkholderia domus]|nr:hypothetical protein R75483_07268 [Paraburkholderia domus]